MLNETSCSQRLLLDVYLDRVAASQAISGDLRVHHGSARRDILSAYLDWFSGQDLETGAEASRPAPSPASGSAVILPFRTLRTTG
jgi:hypothetical protein